MSLPDDAGPDRAPDGGCFVPNNGGIAADSPVAMYVTLAEAFDYFNVALFAGRLPHCLLTLQRHKGSRGYFSARRFVHRQGDSVTDEIALNPAEFSDQTDKDILSTLAHEMAHLWQQHFGTPSRGGYHNAEWGREMDRLGLTPTDSGEPGGKRTGQKMTHLIVPGGAFDVACRELLAGGAKVEWQSREPAKDGKGKGGKGKGSKTKYSCPTCGQNAWARPGALLVCGVCLVSLEAEEKDED
jgi:hypothetical protein